MLLDYESFSESFKDVDEFSTCPDSHLVDYPFSELDMGARDPLIAKSCETAELKALVFRDSFFHSLEPYLSENFKEVVYLWKDYDQKNIEELLTVFKPDIVIEETAERVL